MKVDSSCVGPIQLSSDVLVNVTLPFSTGVGAPRGNSYSVSRGFTGGSGETFFVMSGLFDSGAKVNGGNSAITLTLTLYKTTTLETTSGKLKQAAHLHV